MKSSLLRSIWGACFCTLILIAAPVYTQAQSGPLVNNYGASWYFFPGSYMIVNNDSLHNHAGYIENGGTIRIDGSIYNNDTLAGGASGTGVYEIGGDWVNHATVISRQDTVILAGDATGSSGVLGNQLITGSIPTPFHTLILAGAPGSVKTQTLNASVSGILDLRSSELATDEYEMLVLNTNPNAIWKQNGASGYVSSLADGRLTRATAQSVPYLFPVGTSSSLVATGTPFYYRPVSMTPASAYSNQYSVHLVNDPTGDGYDVALRDDSLELVNPSFYHRLYHGVGFDPATVTMYYDTSTDGDWSHIAHHTNGLWSYTKPAQTGTGIGFSTLSISNWSAFTPHPFALAKVKELRDVTRGNIFVPNTFSPNSDGSNDVFTVYSNQHLGMLRLSIFNRSGEKVFESDKVDGMWDGTYQGVLQESGVYVWVITYGFPKDTYSTTLKGSVTLLR